MIITRMEIHHDEITVSVFIQLKDLILYPPVPTMYQYRYDMLKLVYFTTSVAIKNSYAVQ